ncbi:MAG: glycosyltransferase [Erysipelotrichia bacterium]|nr:glycosyltransferase [Erysipelotrichia bacterium]
MNKLVNSNQRIGFVILHYEVMNETVACIESIIRYIDTNNYVIIVVDNGSKNATGEQLANKYRQNSKVIVLQTGKNNGFSGGNNIGFVYAKQKEHCDFIVMTNNDTELIQDDFFEQILLEYEDSKFAVLGPEIKLLDDSICAYPKHILKLNEIEQDRKRVKKLLLKNKLFIESFDLAMKHFIMRLINWKHIRHKYREEEKVDARMEMVRLHGCCLVFSPIYIEKFDGLDNRTFFYGEEDVLFVRLVRNQMLSVYQPKVKIKHHEQVATSALMNKNYKKRRYTYEQHLQTLAMLETLYNEDLESLHEYIYE